MDRENKIEFLLAIIAVILIGFTLKLAQNVIIIVLLSFLLAYIMDPIVTTLKRIGVPLFLSVTVASLLFLGIFGALGSVLYRNILEFAASFPRFQEKLIKVFLEITHKIKNYSNGHITFNILEDFKTLPIASFAFTFARSVVNYVIQFAVIFIFAVLFVYGKHNFQKKLLALFSSKNEKRIPVIFGKIDREVRKYIALKTSISLGTGIIAGITLYSFNIQYALILGFATFILNYIPSIGSVIATLIPFFIGLAQYGLTPRPFWMLLTLAIMQTIIGNIIDPKLMGNTMNLSLFVIFLSLLFWGWLWGPPGILLAVPMTTSIKIVLENIPSTSKLAKLLEHTK